MQRSSKTLTTKVKRASQGIVLPIVKFLDRIGSHPQSHHLGRFCWLIHRCILYSHPKVPTRRAHPYHIRQHGCYRWFLSSLPK